ncbi:DUF4304 domain-containing protein [Aquimarina sp. ERC-38]|uniref:DUF4304 domain-containing protein n=1 Tax=Aquimarina sp. ERC-38 TaxID=2949996 RepID=UPI002245B37B|nr:DUF4304 domain-containing protein [Aquimarina sp. ERC-38]UZO82387.1 DUF4304 domain-containing protein [Aquimarina sp. ERC-38]
MNAKEKQLKFIKEYLKPKLKENGFRTSGNTWWKLYKDFFILINLQNSLYNRKDKLSFCFNIGVGLTKKMKDPVRKKPIYSDLTTYLREPSYLSDSRIEHKYRKDGWLGYLMTNKTDLEDFTNELSIDFEKEILPKLDELTSIENCLKFYEKFNFWGNVLQTQVEDFKIAYKKSR